MNMTPRKITACAICIAICSVQTQTADARDSALIVNHNGTTPSDIPVPAVNAAKTSLTIVYGHTSHGSQLTTGMTGLQPWKGDTYAWNGTGDDDSDYDTP